MTYETAPQTELVATECAVCSRPLVDAESVETGMGPVCRKKYGFYTEIAPEARVRANRIVWEIACTGLKAAETAERLTELNALGLTVLAAKLGARAASVQIETTEGGMLVRAPYSEAANVDWRRIRGARWRAEEKARFVPTREKKALWGLLRRHYSGERGMGPRGLFDI